MGKCNYINNQILVIRFIEMVLTVLSKYNPMYVTLTFTSPLHSYKIQILIHSFGNIIPSSSIVGSLFPFVITLSEMSVNQIGTIAFFSSSSIQPWYEGWVISSWPFHTVTRSGFVTALFCKPVTRNPYLEVQSWTKIVCTTAKNGVVTDTTSN